ncbi:MAG: Mth938-like domain-containing protein [Gammaproteobacteria bacterium]
MNLGASKSPRITNLSWGRMMIDGVGSGKDFKLWPGAGREWDWRETGTHHVPGIQPADVEELLDRGCRTIVLSRGKLLMLHTCPETLDMLESDGIVVHVAETSKAVRIYNELASRGEAVGGLFHSTC